MSDEKTGADALAEHLMNCRKADAAVVVDGNADELVAKMLAEGWTYNGVEYIQGKRVRYLTPPPGWMPDKDGTAREPR